MENSLETALVVAKDLAQLGRVMEATLMVSEACKGYGATEDERAANRLDNAIGALAEPMVGQILMSSGGYEQTRCHFYQVVGVTAKSVKIVAIEKRVVPSESGYYGYGGTNHYVMPMIGVAEDGYRSKKAGTKRVKRSEYHPGYYVSISNYETAFLWNGKPGHESGDH